ncbi:hypothetical protein J437_LFUL002976 [Ladona fulva]|uniref:Large ribosomal subunit protein bL19m n=1 Tax=Ladona fulva TaxID=123851 RepID=A0A8K0P3G2_LADFU|nr:hypothetical protein J437_LFUL002976 [Ladona fulva]
MKAVPVYSLLFSKGTKPLSTCRGFLGQQQPLEASEERNPVAPPSYRFIYPEFLPDPKSEWRNAIREKLERKDMLERRAEIDIPEFYVGSILAVTSADKHGHSKVNRFVGICIERSGCGLRASFLLRNVVDNQGNSLTKLLCNIFIFKKEKYNFSGEIIHFDKPICIPLILLFLPGIEILYEMYDPKIQKIEVLRLERRLDDHLRYLRNAPPEFSTFPLDMEPEILPENAPVPVNEIKVLLYRLRFKTIQYLAM